MSKFSVKKPLTVFVAVIAVLVLGVVAYLKMTPDLMPNMNFPYIMIVTTYPGASPEKVEQEITKPLEQSMSTLEHIKEVTSSSAENYSMVMLEFEESVNLDTIGVDIQQNINSLQADWDDMVGVPYIMKINPSMLPVMIAAVSMDGMDTVELSEYLDKGLLNQLEGVVGVARITTTGSVTQQLHVVLDQKMIDSWNQIIADAINGKMDDALAELNNAKKELEDARKQMQTGKEQMEQGKQELVQQTAGTAAELDLQLSQLVSTKSQLESTLSMVEALESALGALQNQTQNYEKRIETLKQLQKTGEELRLRQAAFDARIAAIQASGKPDAEIQAEIDLLKATPEYVQFEADKAEYEAQLAANNVTEEELAGRIVLLETSMAAAEQQVEEMKKLLKEQGVDPDELPQQIAQLKDGLRQVEEGIALLQEGKKALNKAQMEGLLELGSGAAELAVGESTVTNAMTQLESGLETLETTREQTLDQADMNNILTMETVTAILTAQNFSMPAGTIQQDGVSYMVSVGEELTTAEQLEDLLLFDLGMEGIDPVYLKDVAAVMVTDNSGETYAKLNGVDGIVLSFEKQSTYATAEVTDNILARFEELEKANPGLDFAELMNQGDYIFLIVEMIISSLLLGAVFAIIILFLFLKDLRPTFITLCSIPISVIFAVVLMYFSGVTINMISLSGLAVSVGMLVDNSVVVIENIYRLRAKGANAIQAAVSGAQQVAGAIIASTLTTVCVFLPIVFVEGITRQMFSDLALTMTYSLMASLIVAMTLVPAMASGMLRKEKEVKTPVLNRLLVSYEKAAAWSLDHKAIVLGVSAGLLVVTAAWSLLRGYIFMPSLDMPNVSVTITMPEDVSMEKAALYADEVLARIGTIDGIETSGATMGSSDLSLLSGSDGYDVTVYITLEDETASGAVVAKQIEALCADLDCEVTATSAIIDISMLTGNGITLEIYSDDMQALQNAAKEAGQVLSELDGVAQVSDGLEDATPALQIRVDRNEAMKKGITVAQIYMELATALQTETTATTLELEGTSTSVIVEKPRDAVLEVEKLEEYPFTVTTQTGETVEFVLGDVATIEETTSLHTISRLNQKRYLTVTAEVTEDANVTLVTAQAEKALRKVDLGDNVTYQFTGENEAIMEAIEQLALMLVLGVLLVYLVMVAQFQSLKSPFIVMFTIPLAFTGGFVALLVCNMEVSVISLIGFIMLTGIIVNNGIVLVDYINQLRLEGVGCREAILEAGKTRMRPILMTTLTTVLGLIDMAVRKNAGTALMQPVAVVCIGGLVYATLMTLVVVPCIYEMMNKKDLRKVDEADLELLDI